MLLKNLKKLYIYEPYEIKDHGETEIKWKYKGYDYFNVAQDINEIDLKRTRIIENEIYKLRTDKKSILKIGHGIAYKKYKNDEDIKIEYLVKDKSEIGTTSIYRMEKLN